MNILIACAAPFSGLQHALTALQAAGLATALPASSPAGNISANDWHARLLAAQGHTEQEPSGLMPTPKSPVPVGKMWEELAVNLLLANMNQSEWGFADERAAWALEFWAGIDTQTRFALGHVPLGQAVALYRQSHPQASEEDIQTLAEAWADWNTELLRLAAKLGPRAMVFDLCEAARQPLRLAHTCTKKLGLRQLDWQKLEGHAPPAWPEPEDVAQLRLRNLGAVRSLHKKLAAASTALLNPNTQMMTTPAADKAGGSWSLFGLFGKSKQLSQDLAQVRFELQKTQAELTQAQEQVADLQAQHEQTRTEHQRLSRLAAEDLKAEKDKGQAALKEQQQEGELLLQQLHQVQEELEQIFLNREEIKKQLQAAEKAKADAETKVAELDKKVKDLDKKAKDLDAAKAKAEAAAAAADKKAADSDKAKAEADKKAADAQAKAAAAEKAAAEAQTKASAADKAKAEADKKTADLAAQLQSAKATLPEQTKALQEAQQENELLLKQLHQVQEELESYFLKNQDSDLRRSKLQERLDRVLMRLPTWADAEQVSASEIVSEADHRCLRLEVHNLWVGQDAPVPRLGFLLGNRSGVPYMEFRPGEGGVANSQLPWPEQFKDEQGERLLLAPGAPGAIGKAQAQVVAGLSASQWRMVKGLLVLIGSQVNRLNLREQAERIYWVNVTRELTQSLDAISSGVHFQSAEVMAVTQPDAGTEVMRVAIRDLSTRTTRVPLCVFELGIKYKTLKSGPSAQVFYMDFRPWKGAVLPFVNFRPNSQDEQGEFLRISVARTGRNKNNPDVHELEPGDRAVVGHIGSVLHRLAAEQAFKRFATTLGQELWMQELDDVGSVLQASAQEEGAL